MRPAGGRSRPSRAPQACSLLLLAALLAVAPDAAHAQMDSREAIALQNQILGLRQDLEQLRRGGAIPPPAMLPPPGRGGGAPAGELVGQLLDRLTTLEEEVRRLRGRVEESEYRGRQLGQTVEKLQGDVDFRLQQLESRGGGGTPAGGIAPRAIPPVITPTAASPPLPAAPAGAVPRPPERAIADGQAALARRDFGVAEAAAREVLAGRGGTRTTDAQLLLGDALAGRRDFAAAALAYNDAYGRNRTSPRAPEALLGLAGAFTEMGNRREACDTLDDLRRGFPTMPRAQAERASSLRSRAGCR